LLEEFKQGLYNQMKDLREGGGGSSSSQGAVKIQFKKVQDRLNLWIGEIE
jgi:hypothetical protein